MRSPSSEESCLCDPRATTAARNGVTAIGATTVSASIIVPAYNAGAYIEEALDSMLSQTPKCGTGCFEFIVVDDGSSDDTGALVRGYGDRVRYHRQDNSGGAAMPRNRGVELASSEFIFFFDADDVMYHGKVQAALDVFAAEPDVGLVFTNFASIDDVGQTLKPRFLGGYATIDELERDDRAYHVLPAAEAHTRLISENFIGTSGVAVRRSVLREAGPFNPAYYCGEDWDMWLRISRRHALAYIPRVLHGYRRHDRNVTGSDSRRVIESHIAMLRSHLAMNTDPALRARLSGRIARQEFSLAYAHYRHGSGGAARRALGRAVDGVPRAGRWWLWLKIAVGVRNTTRIKKLFSSRSS
jgi:glycosyltransferase involved in cell wall biosynthesis